MLCTDFSEFDQCIFFPYNSARVMRITKDQDFTLLVDHGFELVEVHFINTINQFQRIIDHFTFHAFRHDTEGMIYRRLYDHFISRLGETLDYEANSFHNTRNIAKPFPFDLPLLFVVYPFDNTLIVRVRTESITEYFVLTAFFYCIDNKVRCTEIHIGNP